MKKQWIIGALLLAFMTPAMAKSWETDFEKAKATAKAENKHILLDFSGSDWCGWCMKLEEEVFDRPKFRAYANENLVCVLVDFPQQKAQNSDLKEQNKALAKQYKITGYPSIVLLDPEGNFVAKTGYKEGGAKTYVEHLKKLIEDGPPPPEKSKKKKKK